MPRRKPRPADQNKRRLFQYQSATLHCRKCGFYFADVYDLWNHEAEACTLCVPHPEVFGEQLAQETADAFHKVLWEFLNP